MPIRDDKQGISMRMLPMRLCGFSLAAMFGLALLPATAAAARVPQPRELEASLRRLDLPRDTTNVRISNDRFPLHFPVDRHHGRWKTADNMLRVSIHGHGHSARRYQSLSMELLIWDSASFASGLAHTERMMATIGLPDEVRAAAAEMIRATHAQRQTRRTGQAWYFSPTRDAREAAGIQVRMRSESLGHIFLQFTNADAPEARWPTRDDVERLHPHIHRRILNVPADVAVFQDPVMLSLSCRPTRRNAFRCRYLLDNSGVEGRPVDRYIGLFRRGTDGEWTVTIEQPRTRSQDPPTLIWKAREQ
jgi:hypothetical protein